VGETDEAAMSRERVLDVRGLEPPEPLERVLDAIAMLQPGERVRMIHHREPCLLYPLLSKRGFNHLAEAKSEDHHEILIWRRGDAAAAPYGLQE
jgi:TusA-related sulfurtransferase